MISFHGDAAVKKKYLDRVIQHQKADEVIKGQYWQGGKGCAVGCTIHSSNHAAYEKELGLPEWLARLEDAIFEGFPNERAKEWPRQFLEAIPLGVVLDCVKWRFCAFVLSENIERVLALKIDKKLKTQVVSAIRGVLNVHEAAIGNGVFDASAARSAAHSAARSAAYSADSAAASAYSAYSAYSAAYVRYADKLLQLLKESKQ